MNLIKALKAPWEGFLFFIKKPQLWFGPLASTLVAFFVLLMLLFYLMASLWPEPSSEVAFSEHLYKGFAVAAFVTLSLWFFGLGFFYNCIMCFFLSAVSNLQGSCSWNLTLRHTVHLSGMTLYKLALQRLFWIGASALSGLFFGPLSLLILQCGIAHVAYLDGCMMTLTNKSHEIQAKPIFLRTHFFSILVSSVFCGLIGLFCVPTVMVWLFWLPSVYIGSYFFSTQ